MSQLHYLCKPEFMVPATLPELVQHVLAGDDFHAAVALYPVANSADRASLGARIFSTRRDVLMLARWEHTPAAVLEALSQLPHMPMARRVVRHRNTAGATLSQHYASHQDPALPGLLAQHPHAPQALLLRMASEEQDHVVLKCLVRNQQAPTAALELLHQRFPGSFDKELAMHPATSPAMLAAIYAAHSDTAGGALIRAAIIAHPHCPQACVQQAEHAHERPLLRAVAKHPALSVARIRKLASYPDNAVRAAIAAHPSLPPMLTMKLAQDASDAVRRTIASRPDLSADCMWQLAQDQDPWVRQWLARNPASSHDLLNKLALDIDEDVRRAVARNPRCPLMLLKKLAHDARSWVRSAVAYQATATSSMLARLAHDSAVDVLAGVAVNMHTPQPILRKLAHADDMDIRRGVILNSQATRNTLLPLLEDPYYLHRLMLVSCPQLSAQDKWGLRDDPDYRVRFTLYQWLAIRLTSAPHPSYFDRRL